MRNLPSRLPHADTLALIVKAQNGSVEARNAVLTGNMRLVAALAETAARSVSEPELVDDLIMAGTMGTQAGEGLLHAVMTFDALRGVKFSTYAHPFIRKAVNRQLVALSSSDVGSYKVKDKRTTIRNKAKRLAARMGRQPTAEEVREALTPKMRKDCSLQTIELALAPVGKQIPDERSTGGEDEAIRGLQLKALREAADQQLTVLQRDLLSRRYGGERLIGDDKTRADEAEAILREALGTG